MWSSLAPHRRSGDWVTVVAPDAPDEQISRATHYTKQRQSGGKSECRLTLANTRLRFVQAKQESDSHPQDPLSVTAATATLDGPSSSVAGGQSDPSISPLPAHRLMAMAITSPSPRSGAPDNKYVSYYAVIRSPEVRRMLRMPKEPGDYEIAVPARQQESTWRARKPIDGNGVGVNRRRHVRSVAGQRHGAATQFFRRLHRAAVKMAAWIDRRAEGDLDRACVSCSAIRGTA